MVLSKSSSKTCTTSKKGLVQKVVIPKGSVDPEDTIVIEIPWKMQSVPVLLARRQSPKLQATINSRWNINSWINHDGRKIQETKVNLNQYSTYSLIRSQNRLTE